MTYILINFDRVSLALSKADYDVISNYNMSAPEGTYFYHDDYDCFAHLDVDNNPRWFVYFAKIRLGNDECYEITSIKYYLNNSERLPQKHVEINTEVFSMMLKVFTTVDKKLHYNPRNDLFFKYYIRNRIKKTFDIKVLQDKIDITQFAGLLDWQFAIDRETDN